MTSWTFCIYEFPLSLNKLLRMHWSKRHEHQMFLSWCVGHVAPTAARVTHRRRRKATLHFYWPDGRRRDPDNFQKELLDVLVQNDLLIDDSSEWCEVVTLFDVDRDNPRIEITLEEESDGAS